MKANDIVVVCNAKVSPFVATVVGVLPNSRTVVIRNSAGKLYRVYEWECKVYKNLRSAAHRVSVIERIRKDVLDNPP